MDGFNDSFFDKTDKKEREFFEKVKDLIKQLTKQGHSKDEAYELLTEHLGNVFEYLKCEGTKE